MVTAIKVEQCVACARVRVLQDRDTWSQFTKSECFNEELLKMAEKIVCPHCKVKYRFVDVT